MIVKRFFANSSRQALQMVRQGLGPDAVILSNRSVDNGMEILAVAQADFSLQDRSNHVASHDRTGNSRDGANTSFTDAAVPSVATPDPISQSLVGEIRLMRGLIEQQHIYQNWDTAQQRAPGKARVLRDMLHAGFSAALVRQFLEKMPPGLPEEQNLRWVRAVLERNLRTVSPVDEIVERGGVYALVGPTGVGKTTTVAKIAARCVVRYGAEKLALLSTDSYRIGAYEQLRIYGKLLGVRVIAVKDGPDLQVALDDLRAKHLVLIDTVGMGQRDQMMGEHLALLSASGSHIKRLLLLNATGNAETLDQVVNAYRGVGVQGCIVTKTDEAVGIATVLDVTIRQNLPIHYVTDGQRVPEDLHLPDRDELLQSALSRVTAPSVHQLDEAECQLMLATTPSVGTSEGARLG